MIDSFVYLFISLFTCLFVYYLFIIYLCIYLLIIYIAKRSTTGEKTLLECV